MNPRTKLALIQNTFIGIPVIIAISIFNALFSLDPLQRAIGSAIVGYLTSLIFLYISLKFFRIKSKYDENQNIKKDS